MEDVVIRLTNEMPAALVFFESSFNIILFFFVKKFHDVIHEDFTRFGRLICWQLLIAPTGNKDNKCMPIPGLNAAAVFSAAAAAAACRCRWPRC